MALTRPQKHTSAKLRSKSCCDLKEIIADCMKSGDFAQLKDIGIEHGFADNSAMRIRCYSILLGLGPLDICDKDNFELELNSQSQSKYSKLIRCDTARNAYQHWNITEDYTNSQKQTELERIGQFVSAVFSKNSDLNYVQSFNSVFAVFYLISNGNVCIAERLIVSYLHIFRSDITLNENGFGYLTSIWALLRKFDSSFCQWLQSMTFGGESDISFAMEWYTSWFAHSSIDDFSLILRIYDFMIASQNQQIGLYMVVAVLLINKETLMSHVRDSLDLIDFVNNSMTFTVVSVEKMVRKCYEIMRREMKDEQRKKSISKKRNWSIGHIFENKKRENKKGVCVEKSEEQTEVICESESVSAETKHRKWSDKFIGFFDKKDECRNEELESEELSGKCMEESAEIRNRKWSDKFIGFFDSKQEELSTENEGLESEEMESEEPKLNKNEMEMESESEELLLPLQNSESEIKRVWSEKLIDFFYSVSA